MLRRGSIGTGNVGRRPLFFSIFLFFYTFGLYVINRYVSRSWTFMSLINCAVFKTEFSLGFSNAYVIFWTHAVVIELCCRSWTKVSLLNYKKENHMCLLCSLLFLLLSWEKDIWWFKYIIYVFSRGGSYYSYIVCLPSQADWSMTGAGGRAYKRKFCQVWEADVRKECTEVAVH